MVKKFYINFFLLWILILAAKPPLSGQNYCDLMYDANWIWWASDTMDRKPTTVQITFTEEAFTVDTMWRQMEIGLQNCSLSDKTGSLLFYSNGCYVANAKNAEMPNGDTLNPGDVFNSQCKGIEGSYVGSQGMFALPVPGSDSLFYLFHKRFEYIYDPSFHLVVDRVFATVVNPFINEGTGEVVTKNFPVIADTNIVSSNFTAVKHADGRRWWIVTHTAYGNGFYVVLIDSSGFGQSIVQYIGGNTSPDNDAGQLKFSPDGSKLAMYHSKSGVYLFDFDRNSGMLSNDMAFGPIDSSAIIGGCEFSPSGRFLYVNTRLDLYQYDMKAEDVVGSEVHIGHYDGYLTPRGRATRFFNMERTPNGQIFMNCPNQVNVLHFIESPDRKGLDCDFRQHGIILPGNIFWSMPHYPNYRLSALEDTLCAQYVSVDDVKHTDDILKVYPNPAADNIYVETDLRILKQEIHDLSGRKLDSYTGAGNQLNISSLSNGMYVLVVYTVDGRRISRRIVVAD